jgi:Tfp pilus assembly protein PilO
MTKFNAGSKLALPRGAMYVLFLNLRTWPAGNLLLVCVVVTCFWCAWCLVQYTEYVSSMAEKEQVQAAAQAALEQQLEHARASAQL